MSDSELNLTTGYLSPSEIIQKHDERRLAESNRASMSIIGGCRASKSFHNFRKWLRLHSNFFQHNDKDGHA